MLNSQPTWSSFLPYLSKLELFIVVQVRILEAGNGDLARIRGQSEGERAGLLGGAKDGAGTDEVGDGGELVITHHTVGAGLELCNTTMSVESSQVTRAIAMAKALAWLIHIYYYVNAKISFYQKPKFHKL